MGQNQPQPHLNKKEMKTLDLIIKILELAIIPFFIWLFKWVNRKYEHFKKGREAVSNAQRETNLMLLSELKAIKDQVQPNGGKSLNDKITLMSIKFEHSFEELKTGQRNTREIMDLAIWESDYEGRVNYVSIALCELIGCTQTDALDNSWIGLIDTQDRDRVVKEWTDSVRNASEFNSTYNYRKNDGSYQKVKAVAIHNKDERGKVANTLGRLIQIGEPFRKQL